MTNHIVSCLPPLTCTPEEAVTFSTALQDQERRIVRHFQPEAVEEAIQRLARERLSGGRYQRYGDILAALCDPGLAKRLGASDQAMLAIISAAVTQDSTPTARTLYFLLDLLDPDYRDLAIAIIDLSPNSLTVFLWAWDLPAFRKNTVHAIETFCHQSQDGGRTEFVPCDGSLLDLKYDIEDITDPGQPKIRVTLRCLEDGSYMIRDILHFDTTGIAQDFLRTTYGINLPGVFLPQRNRHVLVPAYLLR